MSATKRAQKTEAEPGRRRTAVTEALLAAALGERVSFLNRRDFPEMTGVTRPLRPGGRQVIVPNYLYAVVAGTFRVFYAGKLVRELRAGDIYGEAPDAGHSLYGCEVRLSGPCEVFDCHVHERDLSLRLREAVARELVRVSRRLLDVQFKPIAARLAAAILGRLNGNNLAAGFTQADLAAEIGVYRESVAQTLAEFKRQGYVRIGRRRIEVRNRKALEQISRL